MQVWTFRGPQVQIVAPNADVCSALHVFLQAHCVPPAVCLLVTFAVYRWQAAKRMMLGVLSDSFAADPTLFCRHLHQQGVVCTEAAATYAYTRGVGTHAHYASLEVN